MAAWNSRGLRGSSLEEYIYSKKRDKNNKQDVRCYFNLKECIQINIYLNLDYKEDAHVNKRKKHKVYHLYFIKLFYRLHCIFH